MATKVGSYKGHPTISLNSESKYPVTFGLAKAQAILAHVEEIRAFVAQYSAPSGGGAGPDRFDIAVEDNGARQCGLM